MSDDLWLVKSGPTWDEKCHGYITPDRLGEFLLSDADVTGEYRVETVVFAPAVEYQDSETYVLERVGVAPDPQAPQPVTLWYAWGQFKWDAPQETDPEMPELQHREYSLASGHILPIVESWTSMTRVGAGFLVSPLTLHYNVRGTSHMLAVEELNHLVHEIAADPALAVYNHFKSHKILDEFHEAVRGWGIVASGGKDPKTGLSVNNGGLYPRFDILEEPNA